MFRALRSDRWGVIGEARTARWVGVRGSGTGAARGGSCVMRAACRLSALESVAGSVARAISRSRRCFHKAASVSSRVPPVGRGSWGLMPLAARQTATSPMSVVLGWLPVAAQTGRASPW
jgi:hypothetical protein